jgi:hypothetical protein
VTRCWSAAWCAQGQPLFKIRPDEIAVEEDPGERERRMRTHTERYVERL